MVNTTRVGLVLAWALAVAPAAFGQGLAFDNVASDRGIGAYSPAAGLTSGLAAADFDSDGDIDFFVPTECGSPNQLYENDGNGNFTNIAVAAGVASIQRSRSALFFDYDGDGDLDLLVQHDQYISETCDASSLTLYSQQPDHTFTDVTDDAGLGDLAVESVVVHAGGMCAGDINNDGHLDLCIAQWFGDTFLFLNDGQGAFTDISVSSNVASGGESPWQPVMFDFNEDGWMDIFVAVDFLENHLWINQGDNTFEDHAASAGCSSAWNEMGVTLGDYDNDGKIDMYVTNIDRTPNQTRHNALYHNTTTNGVVSFDEVAMDMGCAHGWWGWGCTFFDADRDGLVDIASTNGFNDPATAFPFDPSKFFWNKGGSFEDKSGTVGFNDLFISGALMAFDYDRDGDLDLLQSCYPGSIRLMENAPLAERGSTNNYLVIKPRQDGPNHFAIGAIIRATVGDVTQSRVITAGISHNSQEPAEAFFGLGDATLVDTIAIQWPDGGQTVLEDVAGNQIMTVEREPASCPGDSNGDDEVNLADLLDVIANWGSDGSGGGDSNGDGTVNLPDLLEVIANWGSQCDG